MPDAGPRNRCSFFRWSGTPGVCPSRGRPREPRDRHLSLKMLPASTSVSQPLPAPWGFRFCSVSRRRPQRLVSVSIPVVGSARLIAGIATFRRTPKIGHRDRSAARLWPIDGDPRPPEIVRLLDSSRHCKPRCNIFGCGRGARPRPRPSYVYLFGDGEGVINLDPEVAHRAFNLGEAQ